MGEQNYSEKTIASIFLILPIIFVIVGLVFFPFDFKEPEITPIMLGILFLSLIVLFIGFLLKKEGASNKLKIVGWMIFAFFWATRINALYYGEDGDIVNASLCTIGIFVLFYVAYHEWLSIRRKKQIGCLNWAAGVASVAGLIYFSIELTPLEYIMREIVTAHSAMLLNLFIGDVTWDEVWIHYRGSYVVTIIFSCTAVQSMVLFVGMIVPLAKVSLKRKFYGLCITLIPIYFLNLVRNAFVAYLVRDDSDMFYLAHNVLGKAGSLIALIALLFIVIKFVPEVFDEIMCLTDLHKRNGPIEAFIKKHILRKKG